MENQIPNQKQQNTRPANQSNRPNGGAPRNNRNNTNQGPNPFQKRTNTATTTNHSPQQNNKVVTSSSQTKKTPAPAPVQEKRAEPPKKVAPPISEEEELLLIEEDGDFFWVIQNIIWGIIKTIAILGGIGLLIWFIWGGSKDDLPNIELPTIEVPTSDNTEGKSLWEKLFGKSEETNTPASPTTTKPNTSTPTKPNVNPSKTVFISSNHAGIIAAQKNAILEENAFGSQNSLENGMILLRKMDDIFNVPLASQLAAPTAQAREAKINAFSMHIHDLTKKSVNMRNILTTEYLQAEGRAAEYAQEARISAQQITNAIGYVQPQGIQALLDRNIQIENRTYTENAEADIRKAIVSKLQAYETALRSVSENINANRDALILDIQVVNYENDPFGRVLTPAQWRSVQTQ